MVMKKIICGVSGVARSGKDTFVKLATNYLLSKGISCEKIALAEELKNDCKLFLEQKLNIDVNTEDSNLKTSIRPFLVWYGDVKRKATNGKFFIDKVDERIKRSNAEFIFVSDVRYSHYEFDELQWIKNIGYLIHITQYYLTSDYFSIVPEIIDPSKVKKEYLTPANEHEKINDPKLKESADYCIEWQRQDRIVFEKELLDNKYMNSFIFNIIDDILKRNMND
jgi:phosphomevalonate kinase